MKTLYYRPKLISKNVLITLAAFAALVMLLIELFPKTQLDGLEGVKRDAAQRAQLAIDAIGDWRTELDRPWKRPLDPAQTRMIGPANSIVTTQPGELVAKQTSINPNYAAVVVDMLGQVGVKRGDLIAIGCTGSFPALDIAAYTAAEAMDLKPVIITSVTSSAYGANDPEMMWPDMERYLFDHKLIAHRSVATSLGGVGDRASGIDQEIVDKLISVVQRNDLPLLREDRLSKSIAKRMELYDQHAKESNQPYAAYINVGGGSASIRGTKGNAVLGDGMILPRDADLSGIKDCVARRFLERDTPVINLINSVHLAETYGLTIAPRTKIPTGEGIVYGRTVYRRVWAVIGIGFILAAAWLIMHPIPALERRLRGKAAQPSGQMMV